jgi:hypothetical protein
MLLQHKPHKYVNLKDSASNTALHLALKSMRHSLQYLNAAKLRLDERESASKLQQARRASWLEEDNSQLESELQQQQARKAALVERLKVFQQNGVAVVEALVMAGADVNMECGQAWSALEYSLWLCHLDHTEGFELGLNLAQMSSTLTLVSTSTIQTLQALGRADCYADTVTVKNQADEHPEPCSLDAAMDAARACFSPYAGVVRLLVLAGAEVSPQKRELLYSKFDNLHQILDEVCLFWDKYQVSRPPKLVHLAKLSIRLHLASIQRLHEVGRLPLPPRLNEYVKLNYL